MPSKRASQARFEGILDHRLKAAIHDRREFLMDAACRSLWECTPGAPVWLPRVGMRRDDRPVFPVPSGVFRSTSIHPPCPFACIELRHSSHTHQAVRTATQHELLERADFPLARLGCPKDTVSQITNTPFLLVPVDRIPVGSGVLLRSVC